MECGGALGGLSCENGCLCFVPSPTDPLVCDCGHKKIRHKPGHGDSALAAQIAALSSKLSQLESGVSSKLSQLESVVLESNSAVTKIKDGMKLIVDEALDPWLGIRTNDGSTEVGADRKTIVLGYYNIKPNLCMITGPCSNQLIKNAHLWPNHTKGIGLSFFELDAVMLNSPRNFLRLHQKLEHAFDRGQLILVPELTVGHTHEMSFRLSVQVLDPRLKASSEKILSGNKNKSVTWSELDGKISYWEFGRSQKMDDQVPFTRVLAQHQLISLKKASEKGWIEPTDLGERKDRALRVLRHSLGDAAVAKLTYL